MKTKDFIDRVSSNISRVIKGKDEEIRIVLMALCAKGHVLLQDVPGTGKTVLAKAVAASIDGNCKRIQFTPDLLPSDITGLNVFNLKTQEFNLKKGPIFTNILLADEINRATPRTQSALLECMEERQTTIDGETLLMENPFLVIATQNPVETQGTYPLPEAQLDRFLIKLSLGYGNKAAEMEILGASTVNHPVEHLKPVVSAAALSEVTEEIYNVKVNDAVKEYITDIGAATRKNENISLGLSTRGLIALMHMAQAYVASKGLDFVRPQDVKAVAPYVIPHRIICKGFNITRTADLPLTVTNQILESVAVPTEEI